jgi:hypothetical protein
MHGVTWGANGVASATITATAAVDATITAMIASGGNQTRMCIYGFPSTQNLLMNEFKCSIVKAGGGTVVGLGEVLYMPDPATNVGNNTAWVDRDQFVVDEAIAPWTSTYHPPKIFEGPGIVKVQIVTNTNDTNCTAKFDGFLVDN